MDLRSNHGIIPSSDTRAAPVAAPPAWTSRRRWGAAYDAGPAKVAYVEFVAVGDVLPEMPLFLKPEFYVPARLEASYQTTWAVFPAALKGGQAEAESGQPDERQYNSNGRVSRFVRWATDGLGRGLSPGGTTMTFTYDSGVIQPTTFTYNSTRQFCLADLTPSCRPNFTYDAVPLADEPTVVVTNDDANRPGPTTGTAPPCSPSE